MCQRFLACELYIIVLILSLWLEKSQQAVNVFIKPKYKVGMRVGSVMKNRGIICKERLLKKEWG